MNVDRKKKYVFFVAILLVGVALDQLTKWYAVDRLANGRIAEAHSIELKVPQSADGESLRSYLAEEFSANSPQEIDRIATNWVIGPDGRRLSPNETVQAGQLLEVIHRKVTVVPGYFDFEYAENRGAAFSFLSSSDSPYRMPFLIGFSILAVVVILYLLETTHVGQRAMIVALSFIATGAVGNLIDRVRLGYVIDFIVWKYTNEYRWPNFNIADSFISVGVVLMLVAMVRAELAAREEDAKE